MKILLYGGPVPEDKRFLVPGFVRSGNLAVGGIAEGLYSERGDDLTCWGSQAVQSFPHYRQFWIRCYNLLFPSGLRVRTIPAINIIVLRELCRGFFGFFYTIYWALKNIRSRRTIIVYNMYTPPFVFLLLAARLTGSRIFPIIFDIGMPPHDMGWLRNGIYWLTEAFAGKCLNHADGVFTIVENIKTRYFPHGPRAMLLDGGLGPEILKRLHALTRMEQSPESNVCTFVAAGSLYVHNGVELLLEAMKNNRNPNIRLLIAGSGPCEHQVVAAAATDARIVFEGMLDLDSLFEKYHAADVILNLRLTQRLDTSTWFPSKFFEAMACGRLVLTTNVAHLKREYGDYCRVLEDETPEALSQMMDAVAGMKREERDAIGSSARTFMLATHTWQRQMARAVGFCRQVMEKNDCAS